MVLKKVGILVGGGPAPGINSVIRAATIKLINNGVKTVGILDGFSHIIKGDISHKKDLHIEDVSRIHFEGGSILGTSRSNPTKSVDDMARAVKSIRKLGIECLITIGGDDTCFSAHKLAEEAGDKLQVVHVPKTIDNDINLPHGIRTFGFATARSFGCSIVRSLMSDAKTTGRWYFVVAMGRKAGHLALGIGSPVGATITIVPEECKDPHLDFSWLVDTIIGSIIKRRALDRDYGVCILAEGLAEKLTSEELSSIGQLEYDDHDHPRLSEIDLGKVVKSKVKAELLKLGINATIIEKNIGYELRCAPPTSFELEYTSELGFAAAKHLLCGGSGDVISIQDGIFVPIPFNAMMDAKSGRTKVRMIEINSEAYEMALEYMIRLKVEDFQDSDNIKKLAEQTNLSVDEFVKRFERVAVKFEG
ncbi:MAG TPA: diphosphate--fructose-6-phosphate 1-phosphotransferase [Nitrospinota bacterium]|nr:diphosphate--fructose-6-phosphate 1-phosphotransferase [Nitrospinota bacterium]|tara:strand:+ start:77811 stop:79067 length:1257 start_codon:yes stop_codon:yes gene_type:complete